MLTGERGNGVDKHFKILAPASMIGDGNAYRLLARNARGGRRRDAAFLQPGDDVAVQPVQVLLWNLTRMSTKTYDIQRRWDQQLQRHIGLH